MENGSNIKEKSLQSAENKEVMVENKEKKDTPKKKPLEGDSIKNYIRVGCKYYRDSMIPDKNGKLFRGLLEWNKSSIVDDFGVYAVPNIQKYYGFKKIPSHTNYQSEIAGFRNEYYKISHEPKEGKFPTIIQVLNHVFQDKIDFGLDYFQLLYTNPSQRLPILLFESNERNTGKSTVGELICYMFQDNAIPLGNSDFESDFSGFWLSKLAIIVDETELNKKGIMPTIKRLSTSKGNVVSNQKNRGQEQIDFFGKFIFMSNEEGKALEIGRGEDRFAVFKVPTLQSVGLSKIPNIEPLLKSEIPAFMYFLINRKMVHDEKDRMYFGFDVYKTKQLELYYKNSFTNVASEINQLIKDTFNLFPEEKILKFSTSQIFEELAKGDKSMKRSIVSNVLDTELKLRKEEQGKYTYFSRMMAEADSSWFPDRNKCVNTHYTFNREDY